MSKSLNLIAASCSGWRLKELSIWVLLCLMLVGCGPRSTDSSSPGDGSTEPAKKILRLPIPSDGPKSMDPALGSTQYDNMCISQVYEPLLQYKYLVRPLELEPLLLSEMPTVSDDGKTYRFKLRKDIRFQDDPCFPDGKGRPLVAKDVFYSWKRLADQDLSLKNWWLVENTIVGLDDFRREQNAKEAFDYDAPVEGFVLINDHEFEVKLTEPVQRFVWTLAMFQTSIVPREAVEKYQSKFGRHPVGTGPFMMKESDWTPNKSMKLRLNPNFREEFYPSDFMPEDAKLELQAMAGKKVPFVDGIDFGFFVDDQPMWLQLRSGKLDIARVPKDNFGEVFNKRTKKLKPEFKKEKMVSHAVPLLDFIFYGFNMDDPLFGGDSEKNRYLRQAIALAIDWEERNDAFYNNLCIIYDGMIPPGLAGYPPDGKGPVSFRGPDLQRARELLAKAGYPNGEGLPTIDFYSSLEGPGSQAAEMTTRQLKKIGIQVNPRLDVFSSFIEAVNNRKAGFFAFAWHSDYPDAENNLALFYGPNEAPGANHFNYKNPEFDKLYEQIRVMPPSPERTAIYEKMRDMVIVDSPFIGSMARTRYYLVQPWLKNCKPTEDFWTWYKYLDLDPSEQR
ncbi:MAG: ABC transporter substrate-binding protein [Pirellulaceae bacterium]|nr:ABC transporter substrate-binding protein [Pirellulaceae bacterium]